MLVDRSMVLLNTDKRMITIRHEPRLVLIKTTLTEDEKGFTLTAEGMDPLTIVPKTSHDDGEEIHKFT